MLKYIMFRLYVCVARLSHLNIEHKIGSVRVKLCNKGDIYVDGHLQVHKTQTIDPLCTQTCPIRP